MALHTLGVRAAHGLTIIFCVFIAGMIVGNVCIGTDVTHEDGTSAEEAIATGQQREQEAKAGDAYARDSADGLVWTVGTKSAPNDVRLPRKHVFRLVSFLNKSCDPALESVDANSAVAPFALDLESLAAKPARTPSRPPSRTTNGR